MQPASRLSDQGRGERRRDAELHDSDLLLDDKWCVGRGAPYLINILLLGGLLGLLCFIGWLGLT